MRRMKNCSLLPVIVCLAAISGAVRAQTAREISPTVPQEKPIQPTAIKAPSDSNTSDSGLLRSVEFRPADQMNTRDREVEANAESAISEHARYSGLEFNTGRWTYEQISCAAFPEHLFLRFMRNNRTGDVSLFSVSIPRNNEGRVRIIPIQLRGYSLFSPAPINALTMSAFNHIRAEENPDQRPVSAWLATGLCYAALAGGHPQLAPTDGNALQAKSMALNSIALNKGLLQVSGNGGASISFDDLSAIPKPMHWSMVFDGRGKLVKASHTTAELLSIEPIKPNSVDLRGKAIAETPTPREIRLPAPGAVVMHPIPPPPSVKDLRPIPAGRVDPGVPVTPPGL